jgi:hypothetical protein
MTHTMKDIRRINPLVSLFYPHLKDGGYQAPVRFAYRLHIAQTSDQWALAAVGEAGVESSLRSNATFFQMTVLDRRSHSYRDIPRLSLVSGLRWLRLGCIFR